MSLGFKRLIYPEPLGPPRPVAGDLYFTLLYSITPLLPFIMFILIIINLIFIY